MVSHHTLELLPDCTFLLNCERLEVTAKIMVIFSSPSTGWEWKERWKREEKRAWAQLPAFGQPSQSHACSAQSSHYDRELPVPAFQTSKCHLPSPCACQNVPSAGLCVRAQKFCVYVRTHSWCNTGMCCRDLQLRCCRISFFNVPLSKWLHAVLAEQKSELLQTFSTW